MATTTVRFVRGRIRAQCKDALGDLDAILAYDHKQLPGTFLTTQQRADMVTVTTDLQILLKSTKPR